ncbi:MAG: DNA gyrase inhibitor YacG [Proteobacteria bacterium]|nr:DNA gyrase inhibitor YacG [Pseudomonadota bacterium]
MHPTRTKSVNCPSCRKQVAWIESNRYRPFCSKRCKLIDFGEWATERRRIPGAHLYPADDDEPDQLQ